MFRSDSIELAIRSFNEQPCCPQIVVVGELYLLDVGTKTDGEVLSMANQGFRKKSVVS
jgi:hypothetical protein